MSAAAAAGGKSEATQEKVAALEARMSGIIDAKLHAKIGQPPPLPPHPVARPAPAARPVGVPDLSLAAAPSSQRSMGGMSNRSAGGGGGLDFLDRLARAESQPATPTSQQ